MSYSANAFLIRRCQVIVVCQSNNPGLSSGRLKLKAIVAWTQEYHPELSAQVSLAIADIMNMGKPEYAFQSEAYQKAFPCMPVVEQAGVPSPFSMWRFLGGQLAEEPLPSPS